MPSDRIQLQLPVPYHREPRDDAKVRSYLERGYTIVQYQRLTDQEVVVTLAPAVSPKAPAPRPPS